MLFVTLSACVLVAATLWVHTAGIVELLRTFAGVHAVAPTRMWAVRLMLLRMIWWLILLHITEISVWGLFYLWRGCMPNAEAAFYFSGVTYTSLGYGDLMLVKPWRLLGPLESLIGILMCGLSTGYFFVVATRVYQSLHLEATSKKTVE
jgi:Ion channel